MENGQSEEIASRMVAHSKFKVNDSPEIVAFTHAQFLILTISRSFMQKNCPISCHEKMHRDPEVRHVNDDEEEFYELSAKTANGKDLSMENFEGYVTVIVNSARVCGE